MTPSERRARLEQAWLSMARRRGTAARLLWPLSLLTGLLLYLRRTLYRLGWLRTRTLPVPVLVVGNVVVGGAGKTPTVIALIQALRARGWEPGVVSRGYGRQGKSTVLVTNEANPTDVGDEPLLIHRATGAPTAVGRDRVQAGTRLLEQHPEVNLIVADDALQHWPLARNVVVTVFDERGPGNGWLLPAGLLREPWPLHPLSATERHFVLGPPGIVPPADPGHAFHVATRRLATEARNATGQTRPLATLAAAPVTALAGIARPDAFFNMLRDHGLTLASTVILPDHASTADYLGPLASATTAVLCTEKDAVKIFPQAGQAHSLRSADIWSVGLELDLPELFFDQVHLALEESALSPARHPSSNPRKTDPPWTPN